MPYLKPRIKPLNHWCNLYSFLQMRRKLEGCYIRGRYHTCWRRNQSLIITPSSGRYFYFILICITVQKSYEIIMHRYGLQWFQLNPLWKYALTAFQLTSGQMGNAFLVTIQGEGFRRLLSADKLMFRPRKARKFASKLLRPFFGLNIKSTNVFIKLKPPLKFSRYTTTKVCLGIQVTSNSL